MAEGFCSVGVSTSSGEIIVRFDNRQGRKHMSRCGTRIARCRGNQATVQLVAVLWKVDARLPRPIGVVEKPSIRLPIYLDAVGRPSI